MSIQMPCPNLESQAGSIAEVPEHAACRVCYGHFHGGFGSQCALVHNMGCTNPECQCLVPGCCTVRV